MPRLAVPLGQPADVRRLAEVLQDVAEHADQPDGSGDRRVPARVDHPGQLLGGDPLQVVEGQLVDVRVVPGQQLAGDPNRPDLLGLWPYPVSQSLNGSANSSRQSGQAC